jgi:predicted ATPase
MLTLGMLCIVHSPKKPAVLCLEEPEDGLHPRRLRWLFDHLLQLAYPPAGQQAVQVILTTHSPYLVSLFSDMPESVLIAQQQGGRSKVTPLSILRDRLHINDSTSAIGHEWATGLYEGL